MSDRPRSIFISGNWPSDYADLAGKLILNEGPSRLIPEQKNSRSIFVAYPYEISKKDYRGAFAEVGDEYEVEFIYADEEITNRQVLEKVTHMIQVSGFAVFDITNWNANVALEAGIAIGLGEEYYVLFDPTKNQAVLPTDLGGIDRLEYEDYSSLKDGLRRLLEQQFGAAGDPDPRESAGRAFNKLIEDLRVEALRIIAEEPGILIGQIAARLAIDTAQAQTIVRPLVGDSLETRGVRRGTRYYHSDDLPAESDEEAEESGHPSEKEPGP